jgi:hypothetical protein
MSCDLVETRMRIRPRESSLSHPFTASWFVPPSKGERTAPWLDRASNAVPARLAATLHDERNRSSTRDACDQLLPTTHRRRAPTFRSATRCFRSCELPRMRGAFSRRPTRFGCFGSWFAAGVFFPWRRPSSHPLTLRHRTPPALFALARGGPPFLGRGGACERTVETTFSRTSRERTHASDDPERLPSAGRRSRRRGVTPGCVSLPLAARSPGFCALPRR